MRRLEMARCQALSAPLQPAPPPLVTPPPAGEPRRRCLRICLVEVLQSETSTCPSHAGATAVELLAVFERATGEAFTETPGMPVTSGV